MWGFKSKSDKYLANIIYKLILDKRIATKYNNESKIQGDQNFLADYIYPLIKDNSLIHDSYFCRSYLDSEPFPTKRLGNCFVGAYAREGCNQSVLECPFG